jgi:hypothetical protein
MTNAAPSRYGCIGIRNDNLLIKPTEVPKITKIAGPIQHDVAINEVNIVPILEIFVLFNRVISLMQLDAISYNHN